MTKVRVTSVFRDRTNYSRVYEVGQIVDFCDEERVRSIVERGLGVIVEDQPVKKAPVKEKPVEEQTAKEAPKEETKEASAPRRYNKKKRGK